MSHIHGTDGNELLNKNLDGQTNTTKHQRKFNESLGSLFFIYELESWTIKEVQKTYRRVQTMLKTLFRGSQEKQIIK